MKKFRISLVFVERAGLGILRKLSQSLRQSNNKSFFHKVKNFTMAGTVRGGGKNVKVNSETLVLAHKIYRDQHRGWI